MFRSKLLILLSIVCAENLYHEFELIYKLRFYLLLWWMSVTVLVLCGYWFQRQRTTLFCLSQQFFPSNLSALLLHHRNRWDIGAYPYACIPYCYKCLWITLWEVQWRNLIESYLKLTYILSVRMCYKELVLHLTWGQYIS